MTSIIEQRLAARQEFLAHYRRVYLAAICREMGMSVDLRQAALREAREMIELAESLLPAEPPPPAK
jgi:hypothetical protein